MPGPKRWLVLTKEASTLTCRTVTDSSSNGPDSYFVLALQSQLIRNYFTHFIKCFMSVTSDMRRNNDVRLMC